MHIIGTRMMIYEIFSTFLSLVIFLISPSRKRSRGPHIPSWAWRMYSRSISPNACSVWPTRISADPENIQMKFSFIFKRLRLRKVIVIYMFRHNRKPILPYGVPAPNSFPPSIISDPRYSRLDCLLFENPILSTGIFSNIKVSTRTARN